MKKTMTMLSGLFLLTTNAFAVEYQCKGTNRSSPHNDKYKTTLKVSETKVLFQDVEGSNFELDRDLRSETGPKTAIYADFGYDGYGGYVKFSIPQKVAKSNATITTPFVAYYEQDTYSESGKVGEVRVKMTCSAINLN